MPLLIALLSLVFAGPANAATITVTAETNETSALVAIQGVLRSEDIETFRFKIAKLRRAIVALESDGGSLLAGIRIGELIRLRSFVTVVPTGARCASACAIAWLGGAARFMGEPALVGFHAAYRDDGARPTEAGAPNAVLGAYLNKIGLPESAIVYITMAAPDSMTWLTLQDAAKYGIAVQPLAAAPPSTNSSSRVSAPEQARIATSNDAEHQTRSFVSSIFAAWSEPMLTALPLGRLYADQVMYYGKETARAEVIADKQRFIERWPRRRYTLNPAELSVSCPTPLGCSARGLVDWETFNPSTTARARGKARFEYVVYTSPSLQIVSETSTVVEREKPTSPGQKSGTGWLFPSR
jgi:hypothetical protein